MIFNKNGLAFPDYQNKDGQIFRRPERHDQEQWAYCKTLFKKTRVCLDIGGHVGITARKFAKVFNEVISFEPIPDLFECLEYNTKEYSNIKIHNVAVTNVDKKVTIYKNPRNSGANIVKSRATQALIDTRWNNEKRQDFVNQKPLRVNGIAIDNLELPIVDFIKIDTEGYNMEPLKGLQQTIERCSPVIQLERGVPYSNQPKQFLENLGYRLIKTYTIDDIFVRT